MKKLFLALSLCLALGAVVTGCGSDETKHVNGGVVQQTPPPYYGNLPGYNNLPNNYNYGTSNLPVGNYYWYGSTTTHACAYGYYQSGNWCIPYNYTASYASACPAGSTYNGWSCVPSTFACPTGFYQNWLGVCLGAYNIYFNTNYCLHTTKVKGVKYCVYRY